MHIPVLSNEVLPCLNIKSGGTYIDATLGGAGHALRIAEKMKSGVLVGIDRDADACERAKTAFNGAYDSITLHIVNDNFCNIKKICENIGITCVDGILFDFGVSSFQIDDAKRGFSYTKDGPLDMRMDTAALKTAADIVNNYTEKELWRIIREYGEERFASKIARRIVSTRANAPITTTGELVKIIEKAVPRNPELKGAAIAMRTFQAIRIEVNAELDAVKKAVEDGVQLLSDGGVIACISFHSLEDRIVKNIFNTLALGCTCPKELPLPCVCGGKPSLKVITKKPITPSLQENRENPRAASAKLRAAIKINSKR